MPTEPMLTEDTETPMMEATSIPKMDDAVTEMIVDEPGKLMGGKRLDDILKERKKQKQPAKSFVDDNFGERPDDPNDTFDYGVGNLVKQTIYALAAALVAFDIYLNSPLFERKAPPPVVTEMSKTLQEAYGSPVTDTP